MLMNNNQQIVKELREGDNEKRKFFLQKLKKDLAKYSYQITDETLEELFTKAIDDYPKDSNSVFYYYAINHIKKNFSLEQPEVRNKLFSTTEMAILNKYLSKQENKYLSTEEIATMLNQEIIEVTKAIYKLKEYNGTNPLEIKKIFPNCTSVLKDRGKERNKTKTTDKKTELPTDDMELLALYTGQINDICLDIEELAKKYNETETMIEIKLKAIFSLLNSPPIKKQVLAQYPEIEPMIKIKEKALSNTPLPKQTVTKERKRKNNIQKKIEFLTLLYSKKEDGSFYTFKELSIKLEFPYQTVLYKKKSILKQLETDKQLYKLALAHIPNLEALQEEYEKTKNQKNTKNEKTLTKAMQKNIEFLTLLYSKKENGSFYTFKELVEILELSYQTVRSKKYKIIKKLNNDKDFKQLIISYIPNLEELQEEYEKTKSKKEKPLTKKMQQNIEFLTQLYSQKEDESFYSFKELATKLEMPYQTVITKKNRLLKKLETDKAFHDQVLKFIPDLEELQDEYNQRTKAQTEQPIEILSDEEQAVTALYTDTTEKVEPKYTMAKKIKIPLNTFTLLENKTLQKIKNNPHLTAQYQQTIEAVTIRENFRKTNSITVTEKELERIREVARHQDIPNTQKETSSKDKLLKGIKSLDESVYKDYASLCTTEQKAMLALRLGFFNETIFGSSDIAELFHTTPEEVSLLTTECLKTAGQTQHIPVQVKQKK